MSTAQDPDELFDLVDSTGQPLGCTKRRSEVHRDGDWHRAIHLWVVNATGEAPWVVLQRRSLAKDTSPGLLDVSVAGHLAAGESADDAMREADEEIGLTVEPGQARWLGCRAKELALPDGGCDRELIDVYVTHTTISLEALCPNPAEVDELVAVKLTDALALWDATRERVRGRRLRADASVDDIELTRGELCCPDDGLRAWALAIIAERSGE